MQTYLQVLGLGVHDARLETDRQADGVARTAAAAGRRIHRKEENNEKNQ